MFRARAAGERDEEERGSSDSFASYWVAAGVVLASWLLVLFLENVVVSAAFRAEFAGGWETRASRRLVIPIALGALMPASFAAVVVARLARRGGAMALLGAIAGGVTGWGVSTGRHFSNLGARAAFVATLAAMSGGIAFWLGPAVASAAREKPRLVAALGGGIAALTWLADARILPRLYPAFHSALLVMTLGAGALFALILRPEPNDPTPAPKVVAYLALGAGTIALCYMPTAARLLAPADNVRLILFEHAPLGGRAVLLAAAIAPPPSDAADDGNTSTVSAPGQLPRSLDWSGRDIVLLTVDALRADHVGAYGYVRPTTPNLDLIAHGGARFDAAYCPTPHTSYSIASLMTGKYMRPLVALGMGDDSDTWAGLLRRYGYRTAAFFPPAVFFIDGERFQALHERGLDFEYRKEEFAAPALRAAQVRSYLESAPRDQPLFLWIHFFEPHEPYVAHPEHPFGASDIDRYDSEIAATDEGIGAILDEVRKVRPGAVVIATADHGEEFGDHGGRYHGTTVYEEQVRVPLLIEGPGVKAGEIRTVAQTIDLLPTVLSAVGIPRPARLRGRDLGPILAAKPGARDDPGLAFAETDEYTLLARGPSRLVCARRAGACALYDRAADPGESHDVAADRPTEARDLRRALAAVAGAHGRFEHGEEAGWPDALRRGIAGDADAAVDVAALLDDARESIRTKAAEVTFDLHAPSAAAAMKRALGRNDEDVRRWCALALVRLGEPPDAVAEALLRDPDAAWRRPASLAFAEAGDARGARDLAEWWGDRASGAGMNYTRATEVLAALAKIRDRAAVPALVRSLDDVRLRPFVADALAEIGDRSARQPLANVLAAEAQVTSRAHEARALARLGGASWSGKAEPAVETTLEIPPHPRRAAARSAETQDAGGTRGLRLVVLASGEASCEVTLDGVPLGPPTEAVAAPAFDIASPSTEVRSLTAAIKDDAGVEAVFLLPVP